MSQTRYLEFDSTYRNRKLYPLQSDFIIEMSQSGRQDEITALDPVSDASPILIWNNNFIDGLVGQHYISGLTVTSVVPSSMGNTVFQIQGLNLKQTRNFYVGAVLARDTGGAYPPATTVTTRRIIDYQPLNTTNALVTLDAPLPDSIVGLGGFYIQDPTPLPTNTANTITKFFIPNSNQCLSTTERTQQYGTGGDNFYINYYVMNTDTGDYRLITAFDIVNRLATLSSPTPTDWIAPGNVYNFVIRKALPIEGLYGVYPGIIYATTKAVQLIPTASPVPTDQYTGDFIRINPIPGVVSPYDITTVGPYNTTLPPNYSTLNCQTEERRIQRYVYGTGVIQNIAGNVISLGAIASSGTEYVGTLISNISAAPGVPPNYRYPTVTIIAYNNITKEATTDLPLGAAIGDNWLIRTCVLSSAFSVAPNPEQLYEIEGFSRDNYNPFFYSGTLVNMNEAMYEIELINLILPNTLLASSRGGRAIFYPYLYVELQQISASSTTNRNVIYSNNPNSYRMLFRAVVDDTPLPVTSPFIKIDSDSMTHVISFKPSDAFRVAIFHANGEPFRTVFEEKFSPTTSNPMNQISACFSFKKM